MWARLTCTGGDPQRRGGEPQPRALRAPAQEAASARPLPPFLISCPARSPLLRIPFLTNQLITRCSAARRDFAPGFFVKHFVKDLGIALEESRKMGLSLPGLALAQQLYVSLMAHGDGELGTQALQLALERLNNIEVPAAPPEKQ